MLIAARNTTWALLQYVSAEGSVSVLKSIFCPLYSQQQLPSKSLQGFKSFHQDFTISFHLLVISNPSVLSDYSNYQQRDTEYGCALTVI